MKGSNEISKQVEGLHLKVKQLLKEGYSHDEIIKQLTGVGIEPYYIETIIGNLENEKTGKKNFRNSVFAGLFYIIAGLILNFLSYRLSVNSNSFFFYLFWGIIVVGVVTIIRGFILYRK
ncbi:MAG TPA: hypothetical protein VN451_07255 [Chitinophagaceae bacterium]|nr:hypothetical protein [Chitinophagaceae bacterium]